MANLRHDEANILVTPLSRALHDHALSIKVIVDDDKLTGETFIRAIAARQAQLSASALKRGDYVIVVTGRGVNVWVDLLALWGLGAIAVACDHEDQFIAHATRCTNARAICGANSDGLVHIDDGEWVSKHQTTANDVIHIGIDRHDHALVLFTSGSTGLPKAVPLSHGALIDNAYATIEAIGIAERQHLFAPVPFRFISGISHFLAAVLAGVCYQGTERRLLQAELVMRFKHSGADAFGGSLCFPFTNGINLPMVLTVS